jgi:hypothetical protein
MPHEYLSTLSFLIAMLAAMTASCITASRGAQRAREILQRGHSAEGRILRVWRPPIAGSFARVYFEFEPPQLGRPIRCCHIDRRPPDRQLASLPCVGASVRVSYLPENPARAVISKLVSRFAD